MAGFRCGCSAFRTQQATGFGADEDDEYSWEEDEDFFLEDVVEPVFADKELYSDDTAAGISLYWAPRPFNLRQVRTSLVGSRETVCPPSLEQAENTAAELRCCDD